jgi:hypothetical protein
MCTRGRPRNIHLATEPAEKEWHVGWYGAKSRVTTVARKGHSHTQAWLVSHGCHNQAHIHLFMCCKVRDAQQHYPRHPVKAGIQSMTALKRQSCLFWCSLLLQTALGIALSMTRKAILRTMSGLSQRRTQITLLFATLTIRSSPLWNGGMFFPTCLWWTMVALCLSIAG